jgi:sporulation protein YlmC with PRC-barrel domain
MKSLKVLFATVMAIALSAGVTASVARDRTNTSKSQTQSRSSNQWQEKQALPAKDAEDTTSRSGWREMGRDDDASPTWRGSAARERMRDQDSQSGMDRQTTTRRSEPGIRELEQLGSARVIFYRLGQADMRMSKLIGTDIRNLQNEDVGEIEDVIFDNGKNMRAVIVSIGGFLGIGERYVAVDPSSIVITRNEDGDVEAVLNTTREDLREAPQFNFDERRRRVGKAY